MESFVLLASQFQINIARGAIVIIILLLILQIVIKPGKESDCN